MYNLLIALLFLISCNLKAQTFTGSNLPIVLITTDVNPDTKKNLDIPESNKVLASMTIIFRPDSTRNLLTDKDNASFVNYNGRIGIELRGSSSIQASKKSYGLTTLLSDNKSNNNVPILGMPKENDWVLNALPFDASLIRDALSAGLARDLGYYASRYVYCELVVNSDYKGLYLFMEKLKLDANRIDVAKLSITDTGNVENTGGYILKADKTQSGEPVAWTAPSSSGTNVNFTMVAPKPTEITGVQLSYIKSQFDQLQEMASAKNTSIVNGYPSIIDVPSFVDFMILNELASNVDAYQYSTFFHKDRNGKLRAGPIWDFNFTYGNDAFFWGLDRSKTSVWQFDNGDNNGPRFWKDLYNDETFKCYLTKRWKELTAQKQPLDLSLIYAKIDRLIPLITEAMSRDKIRWNSSDNHADKITELKNWLQTRVSWINSNLTTVDPCSKVVLPPLVISKINYNPMAATDEESDVLEFIEISNNSSMPVDLTGIYFSGLGISFQFKAGQTIGANEKIYLVGDGAVFKQYYGKDAFGKFRRNLSNKSQKLVLADAFGSIIDQVEYADTAPWPADADGKGSYLKLIDLQLDNSLASSWISSNAVLAVEDATVEMNLDIYPNPASQRVTLSSKHAKISSYEINDAMGKEIANENSLHTNLQVVELELLPSGTYFMKIVREDGSFSVRKLMKL